MGTPQIPLFEAPLFMAWAMGYDRWPTPRTRVADTNSAAIKTSGKIVNVKLSANALTGPAASR
ncbi:MAG: hypothetical protein KBT88_05385 [Gammaproteobacteria bacterium]|nr:hypothetical protein [Gammaproteobacteria bacterium]MBQ0839201.1 hypothetical protein [Gammaproteobacteria bacterium]